MDVVIEKKEAIPCDECPFIHPAKSNFSNGDLVKMAKPGLMCQKNVEKRATLVRDNKGNYVPSHKYIPVGESEPCAGKIYFLKHNARWRKPGR